jgi:hypothetical protein
VSESDRTPPRIRRVRVGHGANCSSVGSVIDVLFATAVTGTALFAAVAAALERERRSSEGEDRRKEVAFATSRDAPKPIAEGATPPDGGASGAPSDQAQGGGS